MEWWGIAAGILAGIGSGVLASWIGRPAAQAAAEETRLRTEQRRQVVADARALVHEADQKEWTTDRVAADPRFLAVKRHLPTDLVDAYRKPPPRTVVVPVDGAWDFTTLADGVDELERLWKLT